MSGRVDDSMTRKIYLGDDICLQPGPSGSVWITDTKRERTNVVILDAEEVDALVDELEWNNCGTDDSRGETA